MVIYVYKASTYQAKAGQLPWGQGSLGYSVKLSWRNRHKSFTFLVIFLKQNKKHDNRNV